MTCDHWIGERRGGIRRQLESVQLTKMAACCVFVCLLPSAESKRVERLLLRSKGVADVKRGFSLKRAAAGKGIYSETGGRVLDQRPHGGPQIATCNKRHVQMCCRDTHVKSSAPISKVLIRSASMMMRLGRRRISGKIGLEDAFIR